MKFGPTITLALLVLAPSVSEALGVELPTGAAQTAISVRDVDTYEVPVGVFSAGNLPTVTARGKVVSQAWRIPNGAFSTLQITDLLREQLQEDGYDVVLECETDACGGFDFRYRMALFPEPEMHVDLGDFRYLTARRDGDGEDDEYISLVVSRGGQSAFVQLTQIDPTATAGNAVVTSTMSPEPDASVAQGLSRPIGTMLSTVGRATLAGLEFPVGSSALAGAKHPSLEELANWLRANPEMTIALVGHTDAQGSLAANMALSKKRAASVRKALVDEFGIPAARIEAQGVGYLVPLASNLTPDGREKNRRVEVVLTSTR